MSRGHGGVRGGEALCDTNGGNTSLYVCLTPECRVATSPLDCGGRGVSVGSPVLMNRPAGTMMAGRL